MPNKAAQILYDLKANRQPRTEQAIAERPLETFLGHAPHAVAMWRRYLWAESLDAPEEVIESYLDTLFRILQIMSDCCPPPDTPNPHGFLNEDGEVEPYDPKFWFDDQLKRLQIYHAARAVDARGKS